MLEMTHREKFLFDLQGFIVVRNFLTQGEVKLLNEAIDANEDRIADDANVNLAGSRNLAGSGRRRMLSGLLTLPHPWCDPFRDLLAHPKLLRYLNTMLGPGWRMDHSPTVFIAEPGAEGLVLHGSTSVAPDHAATYDYANGQMRCGLISVEFNLTDQEEGDGGFAAIPGSHKANFRLPPQIARWDQDRELVRNPRCLAGDMLIFNEATVHGTLPWRAEHQRRALLYRYSPRYLHYAGGYHTATFPDWVSELTDAQRAVLEPPHIYSRPVIQDDGTTVVVVRA